MSDSSENYHGYRFVMDAKSSRQYAIRFDNGKIQLPIQVFAQDMREEKLAPGETVFGFDDDVEITKDDSDARFVEAVAWYLKANDEGKIDKGGACRFLGVKYAVSFKSTPEGVKVIYTMTPESIASLESIGFPAGMPEQFTEVLDAANPGLANVNGTPAIKESLFSTLAFPPHQDGQATLARHKIEVTSQPATPTIGFGIPPKAANDRGDTLPRPTKDFAVVGEPPVTPKPQPPRRELDKPRVGASTIEALIKQYCEDLSAKAEQGRLDPVVGRDSETDQAIKVMSRRKQASLCFTGEAGVGKTAMFSAVAQRFHDEGGPERVVVLDLQAMNAGAQYRGQFEEKLKPLIDGLKEREGWLNGRKIILAIDEIHSQLTSGKAEGGTDSGNMMKPFLTSQGISVMGTTTAEEYRKHIEKDGALSSRFEQLVVGEPSAADTKVILKRLWPLIRDHHQMTEELSEADFDYIVSMSTRYAPNEAQPRKGEKVLDMAGSSARFRGSDKIEKEDITSAVAQMSKLSLDFLNQKDGERFLKMERELPQKVLGQPGIQKVVDGLVGARSGLNDPNQPWGCFVLQGPTGTGKTELCKELARYLFGTEEAMIHLNMGEYAQEHSVARLIGAPPGYVGFDSAEPALTEKIRQRPYSILLLDEIEKAHPKIFDVLLPVLNDGKMEDNHGKTVLFNNVIVVMTTNLGAKDAMALIQGNGNMGFGQNTGPQTPQEQQKALESTYKSARGEFFRPEMVNRIEELGGFVTFLPLGQEVITTLVSREIVKVAQRLNTNYNVEGVSIEVSEAVHAQLSKDGYDPAMGARPMRKVIREQIANPLGKWLMNNKEDLVAFAAKNGGARIVVDQLGAAFAPKLEKAAASAVSNDNKKASTAFKKTKAAKAPAAAKRASGPKI